MKSFNFDDGKFAALRAKGADDAEVLVAIRERWRMAPIGTGRRYAVTTNDPLWGTAIWFDTAAPGDEPNLYCRVPKQSKLATEGTLVAEVRRVMQIPGVNGAPIPKESPVKASDIRKVRAEIKRDNANPLTLSTVEVIEEGEFDFKFFKRTTLNPRTSFDQEMIASMAQSITHICRLNPILIHEDGTIIDGETRHRAGELAKVPKLYGKKLKCTPEQAAVIRLETTTQRRDLNPMDRAVAMKALQDDYGLTVDQVAKIAGMQKGDSVRNIVRLLELPAEWQTSVRTGELTAAAARELVPWKDEPIVLKQLRKMLDQEEAESRSVAIPDYLQRAVSDSSRPLKGYFYDGDRGIEANLKPNAEQLVQLRVREVKYHNSKQQRAFNILFWEELIEVQRRNEANKRRKEAETAADRSRNGRPISANESVEAKAKQLQKRLYRFRIAWLQAKSVALLEQADEPTLIAVLLFLTTREGHYQRASEINEKNNRDILQTVLGTDHDKQLRRIRDLCKQQLAGTYESYHNVFDPDDIETLAKYLKIDMKRDWSASFFGPCKSLWVDFQGLWTKDQMIELLAEWRINIGSATKRAELAELFNVEKPCPKMLLEVKPCSLH